jgi:hypothetical protein
MSLIVESIKFVGGLAGLASLIWSLFEALKAYLKIKVETKVENGAYSIFTEIENVTKWKDKRIDNAFLIIAPENQNILETGRRIARHFNIPENRIRETGAFGKFSSKEPLYLDQMVAFISLRFYYSENIRIGDEKLTYRCSINPLNLEVGAYSVRYFIYGKGRYHRSTQDLLTITH